MEHGLFNDCRLLSFEAIAASQSSCGMRWDFKDSVMTVMDNLMDALHRQVELLRQRLQRFTSSMTRADHVIPVLDSAGLFRRRGVGI